MFVQVPEDSQNKTSVEATIWKEVLQNFQQM